MRIFSFGAKRACALALAGILAFTFIGCGASAAPASSIPAASEQQAAPSTPPADVSAPMAALPQNTTDGAAAMALMPDVTMMPTPDVEPELLPEDLRELYGAAYFLFWHFKINTAFGALDYQDTITADNGMEYYHDNGFAKYSDFDALLRAVFTQDYANSLLNESMAYFNDGNDRLYSLDAARGANMMYRTAVFDLVSASDSEIVFTMTAQYDDSDFEIENYTPEGPTEETFHFRLTKTEQGWRFSEFALAL